MSDPPDTQVEVPPEQARAIRHAIQHFEGLRVVYGRYRPAGPDDAGELHRLLQDARSSGPLYSIPDSPDSAWVRNWIAAHEFERARGEGLLLIARDDVGEVSGFVDLQVWPQIGAAEFGGAIRPDLQSGALGTRGAATLFDWLFSDIGIVLIAMTNALDNIRTEKLLRHLGFRRGRDRDCLSADGTPRPSMYWELDLARWRRQAKPWR